MELSTLTLSDAAAQMAARKISPLELTRAQLDRIEKIDPQLNCFITLTAETALERGREAEAEIAHGHYRGALHGIPIALKDLYETKGIRTTAGSKFFADYVPAQDCTVVEKLNTAGTINLGKLNMHEIALGVTNNNPHFGVCKNPWALDRIPGGSSGGSAAALAAELCLGSMGSDTGGSIRIPASLCGIVGLKPTYGRVSLRGVVPLSWNLDHAGPMARRVRDVALLLQAVAGYDPDDPYCVNAPTDDYVSHIGDGVKGWRVGLLRGAWTEADDEVLQAVQDAARVCERMGAAVSEVEVELSSIAMVLSDAAAFHHERMQMKPEGFGADTLARLQLGASRSAIEYALARRTQTLMRRQYEQVFEEYDLLLTPTTPIAAPLREGIDAVDAATKLTRFTAPFNLTGLPALSVPCGFTHDGLPIGLQIVGPHWAEARVLGAGHAYEQATEWHKRRPQDL